MVDRAELKQKVLELIGEFPKKVALEPAPLESVDCGAYVREKVEYAVEEGERISAYVLVPKSLPPDTAKPNTPIPQHPNTRPPAIFCHHQHNGEFHLGKSEVVGLAGHPDQGFGPELAQQGYVVFAPDAIAFEERNWSEGGHTEYWELATRLVQGRTLMAKALHDVSVGIDYLCSRPDVDPARIGFIGHSYGGRMALWAPAFDDRIRASVSNCGCVNYRNSLFHNVGIQMEFCIPGIMQVAEVDDIATLIAPRPLLISSTDDDVWGRGAPEMYEYAKPFFPEGALELAYYEGKHAFTKTMRDRAYDFLRRRI